MGFSPEKREGQSENHQATLLKICRLPKIHLGIERIFRNVSQCQSDIAVVGTSKIPPGISLHFGSKQSFEDVCRSLERRRCYRSLEICLQRAPVTLESSRKKYFP